MSFILDALKKSEAERLRKDAPGFAAVPDRPREKSTSRWIWIASLLVGINITVLVVIFMKPDDAGEAVVDNPVATVAPARTSIAGASNATRSVESLEQNAAVPVTPPTYIAPPQNNTRAETAAGRESRVVTESYATFNDLRAEGVLQLPEMHLDIHVYSSEPEDRFVFVNMSKYKERATLDEGPVIREITPDGVILEYLGTGFLLPRE